MKKLLLILSISLSISVSAQTDSSNVNVTAAIQARDLLFLIGAGVLDANDTSYKKPYDQIEAAIGANPNYGLTSNINVSIKPSALLRIYESLRVMDYRFVSTHFTRLSTAFRNVTGTANIGRTWLVWRLNIMDSQDTASDTDIINRAIQKIVATN